MKAETVNELCWDHPFAFIRGKLTGANDPRVVAGFLVLIVLFLYWLMR